MKKNSFLFAALAVCLVFASCQKEISSVAKEAESLAGTWKFVNFRAKTTATIHITGNGVDIKTVTTSDYTSLNNTGTVTIDNDKMSYKNLAYDIDAIAYATIYENGVKVDTFSSRLQFSVPSTSNVSQYTRVSSDSIYFAGGNAFLNTATQSTASGAKVKLEQDKLYIIQSVNVSSKDVDQGQTTATTQQADVTLTLQKQ